MEERIDNVPVEHRAPVPAEPNDEQENSEQGQTSGDQDSQGQGDSGDESDAK